MIVQKLIGLILILLGIISIKVMDGNATFSILVFIIGIACLLSKEEIIS